MPIIKSAKKRVRVAEKATIRNVKTKRSLRTAIKHFQAAISGGAKNAAETQSKAQSALDKAAKKNVMHKNKVARKQRQLAAAAKATGAAKPKAKAAKKIAAPAAKKAPAKKPAAKVPVAKKPAAKK